MSVEGARLLNAMQHGVAPFYHHLPEVLALKPYPEIPKPETRNTKHQALHTLYIPSEIVLNPNNPNPSTITIEPQPKPQTPNPKPQTPNP